MLVEMEKVCGSGGDVLKIRGLAGGFFEETGSERSDS